VPFSGDFSSQPPAVVAAPTQPDGPEIDPETEPETEPDDGPPLATATATATATPPPVVSMRRRSAEAVAGYVTDLGSQLLRFGCPTYRVEQLILVVTDLAGHDCEVFALPTALHVMVVPRQQESVAPIHRLARVRETHTDLGRLGRIDELFNAVADQRLDIATARAALRGVAAAPALSPLLSLTATTGIAGASAFAFGGGLAEASLAVVAAVSVWALERGLRRRPDGVFLLEFLAGFVTSSVAYLGLRVLPGASAQVVILAGLIALFPGMAFTTGVAELAQRHMVAGAARLLQAIVTLVALVFGLALALGGASLLHAAALPDVPKLAPDVRIALPAALVSGLSLAVIQGVPRKELAHAVIPCFLAEAVYLGAVRVLPGHLAAFLAALSVCAAANALARLFDKPAQLFHTTAITLLVPGSFGFLSFDGFLRGESARGLERAVAMVLVAGGLVMGVLLANVLVRPRKLL
jgi:uncharacterized membrane protein YjjP (DUF1212 family)